MEPIRRLQDDTPGRPAQGSPHFSGRPQPGMDGFGPPRPFSSPAPGSNPASQAPSPLRPFQSKSAQPAQTPQLHHPAARIEAADDIPRIPEHASSDDDQGYSEGISKDHKASKEPSRTGHAGWVGLLIFVVLGGLLLSSLLSGKTLDNFPGSSQSFSTGDQALACAHELGKITSSQSYDTKLGAPIVYSYATSSHQSATCDGRQQTVVSGHSSQFNPLGAAIDIVLALVVAIIIARIWRRIFGEKH